MTVRSGTVTGPRGTPGQWSGSGGAARMIYARIAARVAAAAVRQTVCLFTSIISIIIVIIAALHSASE
jgi:hypothetical protein